VSAYQHVGESVNQKDKNADIRVTFLDKKGEVVVGEIGELLKTYQLEEIQKGLQTLIAPQGAEPTIQVESPGENYLPETDTFDTWFSSGHWPLVTLNYPDGEDYKKFYPTSVMETGWEIIRFWVSRMIMFGIYLTGEVPFEQVYLHGMVRALDGKKMSKSLGNVINPEEYMEQYGVDALRMGLISGTANGKDFSFPKDKVMAYRKFGNKLWNMARFYLMMAEKVEEEIPYFDPQDNQDLANEDKEIVDSLNKTIEEVDALLGKFRFSEAADTIYHYMWDEVASSYIEHVKGRKDQKVALSILRYVFLKGIMLLHPFMPFVTEAIWQEMPRKCTCNLITSKWPGTQ
jgi:valyl-tRNA synthetase